MTTGPGPLAGIRVIEFGGLIAGPYASSVLAQFGAEVIKVEAPGEGDPLRTWRKLHEGTSRLVVFAQPQQEVDHAQPESRRRASRSPRPGAHGRHRRRELPARRARGLGAWLGRPVTREPVARDGAHLRLRADRALQGPARLRGNRRGDGRPAARDRLPGSARPCAPGVSLGDSLAALYGVVGALMALHHVRERRPGAVRGCRAVRVGVRRDGEPAAGVLAVPPRARAQRRQPAGDRAVQHLSVQGRQLRGDCGQQRRHLQAPDAGDRPRRSRKRSITCAQRRTRATGTDAGPGD